MTLLLHSVQLITHTSEVDRKIIIHQIQIYHKAYVLPNSIYLNIDKKEIQEILYATIPIVHIDHQDRKGQVFCSQNRI